MALFEEEPQPRASATHQIGSDLSRLSVEELAERVALLKAEAKRLEDALRGKTDLRSAADGIFRL